MSVDRLARGKVPLALHYARVLVGERNRRFVVASG